MTTMVIYIYIYAYIYTHTLMYIYVYIYIYAYIYTYIRVYIYYPLITGAALPSSDILDSTAKVKLCQVWIINVPRCGCTIDAHGFINPVTGRIVKHLKKRQTGGVREGHP